MSLATPGWMSSSMPALAKDDCSDWAIDRNGWSLKTMNSTLNGVLMPASARIFLAFSTSSLNGVSVSAPGKPTGRKA
jgi:hypothetical protein